MVHSLKLSYSVSYHVIGHVQPGASRVTWLHASTMFLMVRVLHLGSFLASLAALFSERPISVGSARHHLQSCKAVDNMLAQEGKL